MKKIHERTYEQLTATFSASIIKRWEKTIETWENDPTAPNPYSEPSAGMVFSPSLHPLPMTKN